MPTRLGAGLAPRIEQCLRGVGADPDPDTIRTLAAFLDRVVEWNAKVDLTAARDDDELVDLFVADAAVVARLHGRSDESWVDVGSGAGAPGIPLALLTGGRFTLVEPKEKRVAFLRTLVGALGLEGVTVRRDRSDAVARQGFDVAISRATLEPPEWLVEGARLARRAVWVLVARVDPPTLEGWQIDRDESYALPLTGAARRALRYVPVTPARTA
ncbi:MAG: 16S rRNA (guanine(527)-N(7))-methyltransferase RsmG [Polyangiaceae bacterium]|nr:16S rRNA (guanine(527)-N(7))-methyltransferase RsmG [Polyangiaceae bacterium]